MNADAMNSDAADRLRNWADDYVKGALSPADRETLERELLASDEARRFFVSYLELHAGLAWEFRSADCELPVRGPVGQVGNLPIETRWDGESVDPPDLAPLTIANAGVPALDRRGRSALGASLGLECLPVWRRNDSRASNKKADCHFE
jgi:hypothetical protein